MQQTGITIGFHGFAGAGAEAVRSFENEVLELLPDHGAKVLFRGHRSAGEPAELPVEFHVLWFPTEDALRQYLADPRRVALLAKHGEVFSAKSVVRLDVLTNAL